MFRRRVPPLLLLLVVMLAGKARSALLSEEEEESCASVAASLNAAFRSGEKFDAKSESVESYMARSGLLVIMCTTLAGYGSTNSTECDEAMDHLSASFINNVTGYRTLPSGFGSVVDVTKATVLCAYPADAATDSRDGRGCGPFSMDPEHGSQGFAKATPAQRLAVAAQVKGWYASLGVKRWDQVDCATLVPSVVNDTAIVTPDGDPTTTFFSYFSDCYAPFLGHPLCVDSSPQCSFQGTCGRLEYLGPEAWPPEDFADVLHTQNALHAKFPVLVRRDWNEVILEKKKNQDDGADFYRAVFYVRDPIRFSPALQRYFRRDAIYRAKKLGRPLVVATLPWATQPCDDCPTDDFAPWPDDTIAGSSELLFECDDEYEASKKDDGLLLDLMESP